MQHRIYLTWSINIFDNLKAWISKFVRFGCNTDLCIIKTTLLISIYHSFFAKQINLYFELLLFHLNGSTNKLKVRVSEDNVSAMSKSAFEITTSTNIQSFFDTLSCYCSFKSITKLLYFVHHTCTYQNLQSVGIKNIV